MEHLQIFIYAIALVIGSATLIVLGPLSVRARNTVLLRFFLFFSAYTLDIFSAIVYHYIRANLPHLLPLLYPYGDVVMNLFHYFLMFAILQFLTVSLPKALASRWSIACAGLSIACLICDSLFPEWAFAISRYSINLTDIVFFGCIAFAVTRGISSLNKGGENERKFFTRAFAVVLFFFPLVANDDIQWLPMPVRFSPLQYAILSALLLAYVSRFYLSEYYVSSGDITCLRGGTKPGTGFFERYGLSARELEICLLVLRGYSNRRIADGLYISLSTVKSHVYSLYQKVGVSNRFELMQLAKIHTEV